MAFSEDFERRQYYINCFDEEFSSYRITLYPNFSPAAGLHPLNNLTVEVIAPAGSDPGKYLQSVISDVHNVGIVSQDAQPVFVEMQTLQRALPVLTNSTVRALEVQKLLIES